MKAMKPVTNTTPTGDLACVHRVPWADHFPPPVGTGQGCEPCGVASDFTLTAGPLTFGVPPTKAQLRAAKQQRTIAARIGTMHRKFGVTMDRRCGACQQFYQVGGVAGTYFKCKLFGISGGPGTDWRKRWVACGKFVERAERR